MAGYTAAEKFSRPVSEPNPAMRPSGMSPLPTLSASLSPGPARTVILVDMPWGRDKDPRIPLGHASLLAALRRAGVETRSVVAPVNAVDFSVAEVLRRICTAAQWTSDERLVIALGAYVWNEPAVQSLLRGLAGTHPEARLVVGGPQVTFADDATDLYPSADCIVRGAAEDVLVALASAQVGAAIPGVIWRGQRDGGCQARVELGRLASPFLDGVVPVRRGSFLRWETKRGCRFACSFCQHRNPASRDFQRLADVRVRDEIHLFSRRQVADIAVLDPVFNDGERSLAILEECKRAGLGARLSIQARLEMTDEALLEAARGLDLRLEFGLQTIHPVECRAVERPNNMRAVEQRLELVRRAGHPFEVSLIYGLPNQTYTSFVASVRWCLEQGVPTIKAFPLMLLRGTKLERERRRWSLIESDDAIPQVVSSSTFDRADHGRMAALSEALRATETRHPLLEDLLGLADRLALSPGRFSPRFAPAEISV